MKFRIIDCMQGVGFTNRTSLPLCTVDFIHRMVPVEGGMDVMHRIEIKGLVTPLFSRIIGNPQKRNLACAVDNSIALAQSGRTISEGKSKEHDTGNHIG